MSFLSKVLVVASLAALAAGNRGDASCASQDRDESSDVSLLQVTKVARSPQNIREEFGSAAAALFGHWESTKPATQVGFSSAAVGAAGAVKTQQLLQVVATPIAPFGREDTAQELQDHSARTQDTLVDAVENAEVAEIKRAVFRSLTRLRAAQIKEFDTIARMETMSIDGYNDEHHYRAENPIDHLSANEGNVSVDKLTSFHNISQDVSFLQIAVGAVETQDPQEPQEPQESQELQDHMTQLLQDVATPIAPFGREDTAQELQDHSARTQDTLVDAVENAEVAEIKRAVFRSLTRLRAAEIKEFDTIARMETQAIDEYNDEHHYRSENPIEPLSARDAEVSDDKLTSFHD